MSDADEFRVVSLSRNQRNVLEWAKNHLECHAHDLSPYRKAMNEHLHLMAVAAGEAEKAWDIAPEDPWTEIAEEFKQHRCKDADCFAESVLMRLGAIRFHASPWDLP